jgi:hypothetical protein
MIKKFSEFSNSIKESFNYDEFDYPTPEEILANGYKTVSETYTPIWIGYPISEMKYSNEWSENDWKYEQNISFSENLSILSPCPSMLDAIGQIVEKEKDRLNWYQLEQSEGDYYLFLCFDKPDETEPYSNYIIIVR